MTKTDTYLIAVRMRVTDRQRPSNRHPRKQVVHKRSVGTEHRPHRQTNTPPPEWSSSGQLLCWCCEPNLSRPVWPPKTRAQQQHNQERTCKYQLATSSIGHKLTTKQANATEQQSQAKQQAYASTCQASKVATEPSRACLDTWAAYNQPNSSRTSMAATYGNCQSCKK
jgi:hypothetical protein